MPQSCMLDASNPQMIGSNQQLKAKQRDQNHNPRTNRNRFQRTKKVQLNDDQLDRNHNPQTNRNRFQQNSKRIYPWLFLCYLCMPQSCHCKPGSFQSLFLQLQDSVVRRPWTIKSRKQLKKNLRGRRRIPRTNGHKCKPGSYQNILDICKSWFLQLPYSVALLMSRLFLLLQDSVAMLMSRAGKSFHYLFILFQIAMILLRMYVQIVKNQTANFFIFVFNRTFSRPQSHVFTVKIGPGHWAGAPGPKGHEFQMPTTFTLNFRAVPKVSAFAQYAWASHGPHSQVARRAFSKVGFGHVPLPRAVFGEGFEPLLEVLSDF